MHGVMVQSFGEGGKFVTEEAGHALEEKGWDWNRLRHKTIIMALCESKN
jgi:hypothetical protein